MLKTELNTSNKTSQDLADVNGRHTRGVLQKSPSNSSATCHGLVSLVMGEELSGHEWSITKPLGIQGSEVTSEK